MFVFGCCTDSLPFRLKTKYKSIFCTYSRFCRLKIKILISDMFDIRQVRCVCVHVLMYVYVCMYVCVCVRVFRANVCKNKSLKQIINVFYLLTLYSNFFNFFSLTSRALSKQ